MVGHGGREVCIADGDGRVNVLSTRTGSRRVAANDPSSSLLCTETLLLLVYWVPRESDKPLLHLLWFLLSPLHHHHHLLRFRLRHLLLAFFSWSKINSLYLLNHHSWKEFSSKALVSRLLPGVLPTVNSLPHSLPSRQDLKTRPLTSIYFLSYYFTFLLLLFIRFHLFPYLSFRYMFGLVSAFCG